MDTVVDRLRSVRQASNCLDPVNDYEVGVRGFIQKLSDCAKLRGM